MNVARVIRGPLLSSFDWTQNSFRFNNALRDISSYNKAPKIKFSGIGAGTWKLGETLLSMFPAVTVTLSSDLRMCVRRRMTK